MSAEFYQPLKLLTQIRTLSLLVPQKIFEIIFHILKGYQINSSLTSCPEFLLNKELIDLAFWSMRLFSLRSQHPREYWFISMSDRDFISLPVFTALPASVNQDHRHAPLGARSRNSVRPSGSALKAGNTQLWPGLLKSIWHGAERGSRWQSIATSIFSLFCNLYSILLRNKWIKLTMGDTKNRDRQCDKSFLKYIVINIRGFTSKASFPFNESYLLSIVGYMKVYKIRHVEKKHSL